LSGALVLRHPRPLLNLDGGSTGRIVELDRGEARSTRQLTPPTCRQVREEAAETPPPPQVQGALAAGAGMAQPAAPRPGATKQKARINGFEADARGTPPPGQGQLSLARQPADRPGGRNHAENVAIPPYRAGDAVCCGSFSLRLHPETGSVHRPERSANPAFSI